MINIALGSGDHQGDLVPKPNSHPDVGGVPAITIATDPSAKAPQKGFSLFSPGGTFRLTFLTSGGAVIQCVDDSTLQWQSGRPLKPSQINWVTIWTADNTANQDITEIDMQADGNFVVYSGTTPLYNSQTDQHNTSNGFFLRMQDDGNLVIYDGNTAKWSTGTYARGGGVLAQRAAA
jgi:hypothetical protein